MSKLKRNVKRGGSDSGAKTGRGEGRRGRNKVNALKMQDDGEGGGRGGEVDG